LTWATKNLQKDMFAAVCSLLSTPACTEKALHLVTAD